MLDRQRLLVLGLLVFLAASPAHAFLEDLCLPRQAGGPKLSWCLNPTCQNPVPNRACPQQLLEFATIKPGRSMIHADSTYFIAQALGYRADVAYWIAAYNEVTDYTQYVPIDQCGVQAANENTIQNGNTLQTAENSGRDYITAEFNGFQRTNLMTDGPLDHYIASYSPNGQGTDVHGAMGVQALYPLYYPRPGYPVHIDDTYQKTIANLRQWSLIPTNDPGVLCAVGLTGADGKCLSGGTITGKVPLLVNPVPNQAPLALNTVTGPKILDLITNADGTTTPVYYDKLESYLNDPAKTTGKLWLDQTPGPVPVQIARFGLYLHVLQDSSSHATYCGDDAPSPPGGGDIGTYMTMDANGNVTVNFGGSCGFSPHLAGHVQETGTGDASLPLRVYVALNNTVDELIVFGNTVAKQQGWISNPRLLPPDVIGGRNALGKSASDLQQVLVGRIVEGQPYTNAEVYRSGRVTLPLQSTTTVLRLQAMNASLAAYSNDVAKNYGEGFVPFVPMPGNSADSNDTSVCWKPAP